MVPELKHLKNLLRDLIHPQEVGRWVPGGVAATHPLAVLCAVLAPASRASRMSLHRNYAAEIRGRVAANIEYIPVSALTSDLAGIFCQLSRLAMQSSVRLALEPLATVFSRCSELRSLPLLAMTQ